MGKINIEKIDQIKDILNIIDKISKTFKISDSSSYYLIRIMCNQAGKINIEPEDYLLLMKNDLIKNGKATELAFSFLNESNQNNENNNINSTLPIITSETGNITKRLATHFLSDMFKGKDFIYYNEICNNKIMAPFFFIFMNMFPSSNESKNKHWDKHFHHKWSSMTLRRVTSMTVKNFKKVYKTKDIGLFLLGTYMFIKESYNADKDKYYIKSLENYWKEYDEWYRRADSFAVCRYVEFLCTLCL